MYGVKAFKCRACPEKQDDGCPAWMEIVERNVQTGEARVTKGCLFPHLPRLLMYSEHAANVIAGETSRMRRGIGAALLDAIKIATGRKPVPPEIAEEAGKSDAL